MNKVIIDTPVWIEYFRNSSHSLTQKVDECLSQKTVYMPKVVIAGLLQGAKSHKETTIIEKLIEAFHIIDQKEDTWIKAGQLSHQLKKAGKNVPLMECYLAVIAKENDCAILTLDSRFGDIQKVLDISLL